MPFVQYIQVYGTGLTGDHQVDKLLYEEGKKDSYLSLSYSELV